MGPEPDTLTVPWGDTLRITNVDTVAHSLVSSHPELQTGVLLPGKTFTTTITAPAHNYSFRQIGGKGFPGKIEVDFTGHVSLVASRSTVDFGRAVRLGGTTSVHSTPGGGADPPPRRHALDDPGDGVEQRLGRVLGDRAARARRQAARDGRGRPDPLGGQARRRAAEADRVPASAAG